MHVELKTPGVAKPRTYSIACAPDDQGLAPDGLLEFFVTRHERGQADGWLHGAELGASIDLHGPWQLPPPQGAAGPLLCLAGGSGLAPILAIVRRALATGHADPIELTLSVRDRSEAFALDALHALARRHVPTSPIILTRARGGVGLALRSRISDWLATDYPDLADWHTTPARNPLAFETQRSRRIASPRRRLRRWRWRRR